MSLPSGFALYKNEAIVISPVKAKPFLFSALIFFCILSIPPVQYNILSPSPPPFPPLPPPSLLSLPPSLPLSPHPPPLRPSSPFLPPSPPPVQYKLSEDPKLLRTGEVQSQADSLVSLSRDARVLAVSLSSSISVFSTSSGNLLENLDHVHKGRFEFLPLLPVL